MLIQAVADYFKYKVVGSIFILTCSPAKENLKIIREISQHGLSATCSCNFPATFNNHGNYKLQGILYIKEMGDEILEKVKPEHFSPLYKWLIIGEAIPFALNRIRYDSDATLLSSTQNWSSSTNLDPAAKDAVLYFQDIYIRPSEGASVHLLASWTRVNGFMLTHEREKLLRRLDLKNYPMRIATPIGQYSEDFYNGTFGQYLADEHLSKLDSTIRSGYIASQLIIERLGATEVLLPMMLWSEDKSNDSMLVNLAQGNSELGGGVLRFLKTRALKLDYVMPIWPFHVGFTYLAERESSSNMFVEPFATGVWGCCLGIGIVLAIAQRFTSRSTEEIDGVYIGALATWLQQDMLMPENASLMAMIIDASAVPRGVSGRWTFLVLSTYSMLVHAYYTSAIVSALMSMGRSGPDSLRSLADSRYGISSEDYDYMRYLMFDVKTDWEDLEYLKRKKMTSKFYQDIEHGVELIKQGNTAFHTEYNQIFPYLMTFSDDHICKLQYVDTVPEVMSWITTTRNGQWTNIFRSSGAWLHETGLSRRLVSRLRARSPLCRASLLAERVKFGDVAPLVVVSFGGAVLSLLLLGLEILSSKWRKVKKVVRVGIGSAVSVQ